MRQRWGDGRDPQPESIVNACWPVEELREGTKQMEGMWDGEGWDLRDNVDNSKLLNFFSKYSGELIMGFKQENGVVSFAV